MKMRLRPLLQAFAASLLLILPFRTAGQDTDALATLTNLLTDLKQSYGGALQSDSLLIENKLRREELSEMVKAADEVTLMLYTQEQEFAFDMAFALEEVSRVYDAFHEKTRLGDKYLIASRSGLRRYSLLEETLQGMYTNHAVDYLLTSKDSLLLEVPFIHLEEENPEKKALLDSCLHYTRALIDL